MTEGARRAARSDVVIVGAGASAGVAALALVRAGVSVTCFEQGEWPDRSSFGGDRPAGELIAMTRWSTSPAVRGGPADYPIDVGASDMAVLNWNGVGGGSVLYNGQWPRLHPSDFRVRSTDGVGADWPLTYEELQPFYEATDRQFGVSGLGGNPAYPAGEDPPLPPLPIGPLAMAVARAHARLGWHWWPDNNAINSVEHEGRHACVQRGTCSQGCNEGAKASTDLTHWPEFQRLGGALVTGAAVRRVLVDRTDRATGIEWVDRAGNAHLHQADVVLCAANGIGTPRLLLASADDRHPDGLANDSGMLGRCLMLHPMALVQGVLPGSPPWHGHNGGLINSMQFYGSDASRGFVRGARWALTAGGAPLATALGPRVGWGADHHRQMRANVGRRVTWVLLAEDLPDEANEVVLSAEAGGAGIAGARVRYRVGGNTERLLAWHAERAMASLTEAGVLDITVSRARANGHFMGTARMGDDPATSVCDRWGFTHRIRNLGILDGSVFPTAGGMNPTSTICALALRTAQHLLDGPRWLTRPASPRRPAGQAPRSSPARRSVSVPLSRPASAPNFSLAERRRLGRWADDLIPAGEGMPAATDVGVNTRSLDALLQVRPDLGAPLRDALARNERLSAEQLRHEDRAAFKVVALVVAGAYYLSPQVREALDWRGEAGRPVAASAFPAYVSEGLLDHLVSGELS